MVIGAYAVAKSKFPIHQRHVLHAVLFLAISDFLSALSWLGSYADTSCLFAGIVKIFFLSMSELGTVAFAASIFLVVLDK
jgi:hypothetical protein